MPNEHRADPTPPPHHGQGRGGSKKESFSLRVSPVLHPPERPSPRRADMAGHGLGREGRGNEDIRLGKSMKHLNVYLESNRSASLDFFCVCSCMAINVSVQYSGEFLPDMMLLAQCYYHHWRT